MESNPSLSKRPVMDFVRAYLKEHSEASFQEVRSEAEREGYKLYPIVYGRAKSLEGLVPMKPRRRPPKSSDQSAKPQGTLLSLEDIVNSIRETELQRNRYSEALVRIQQLIGEALEP